MGATLAKTIYRLRRGVLDRIGLLAAVGAAALLWQGFFVGSGHGGPGRWQAAAAAALAGLWLLRVIIGRPARHSDWQRQLDAFEGGLLLLCCVAVAIQIAGGPGSWAQPLAYLAVSYLVGFNTRPVGATLALAALALQGTLHRGAGELPLAWQSAALQSSYLAVFAGANLLFLQSEVARRRLEHEQRLADDIRAMREEARDYRLIGTPLASGAGKDRAIEEAKLARGAVEAIHHGLFFMLDLMKQALDARTCVVLWLDASGERLKVKELVTDSVSVLETDIPAQAGALGGIVKNRLLLNLRRPRAGRRGIAYYSSPEEIGAFLGVPVLEDGHTRGILCVDRDADRPFAEAEEKLLSDASAQILRSIQAERVFAAVERSKYEHERFYRASTMLNGALTLAQVYETAFGAARQICDFDFGAVTLYDRKKRAHTICRVEGEGRDKLEGASFGDNAGLVAMVVKNRHFLPAGDGAREKEMVVFTRRLRVGPMPSLIVLPLIVQDNAIGTFVLAARRRDRLPKQVREMLGVISNQVAVSIENAKMYKLMEEMATTDGLTGLPNHRTFQSRFTEMLDRAERHGKPVSIVLSDVDHFKSVNDTYGHPVGDAVLQRVSKVMAEQVRKVDMVARYGGEEFVMILEEGDAQGARLLCERVREQIGAQVMSSEKGSFRVTISLGIASYPTDGKDKVTLIERADQALYAAKQGGRNRSVAWSEIKQKNQRKTA